MAAYKPVVVRICSRFAGKSNENSGSWHTIRASLHAPDQMRGGIQPGDFTIELPTLIKFYR